LKASKWNVVSKPTKNGRVLVFNSLNKGLASFDRRDVERWNDEPTDVHITPQNLPFLLGDEVDEDQLLAYHLKSQQFCNNVLDVTIVPNYSCNLRCEYCFGKYDYDQGDISRNSVERIVGWVDYLQDLFPRRNLTVVYTGGEPLLNRSLFMELAAGIKNGVHSGTTLSQSIITNGTLIDMELLRFLRDQQVNSVQLTLDGDQASHDSKRTYPNGKGTYNRVIAVLEMVVETISVVYLRINFDYQNKDSISHLLDELEARGLQTKIILNPARIIEVNRLCNSVCLERRKNEYSAAAVADYIAIYDEIVERGFRVETSICSVVGAVTPCMFHSESGFTVDCRGDVYKCNMLVGQPAYRIGNILQDYNVFGDGYRKCLNSLLEVPDGCRNCPALPICNGGCRYGSVLSGNSLFDPFCEKYLFTELGFSKIDTLIRHNIQIV